MIKGMLSNVNSCRFLYLTFMAPLFFSSQAWSFVQGEIVGVNGGHRYNIDIESMDLPSNQVGTTVERKWDLGSRYDVYIHCPNAPITTGTERYYTGVSTMTPSPTGDGFLKLNDYFDVKVEVYVINGEKSGDYYAVPFYGQSNNVPDDTCKPDKGDTAVLVQRLTLSGSEGKVTFRIRKPLINGLTLNGQELVKLYGRVGNPSVTRNNPLSIVTINSGVITVPDKCTVNEGAPIKIDFKEIPGSSSMLNGKSYQQPVPIKVKCTGGSFAEEGNLRIKMGIQATVPGPASFNPDYIGTTGSVDRSNLGIALSTSSGTPVIPNKFYDINEFSNNQGSWDLVAAPVAKPGSEILEGDFSATASIVAEFQ